MEKKADNLLNLIDNRIRSFLNKTKLTKLYSGIIVKCLSDDWVELRLAGEETIFTMPNHSGEALEEGDSVYIRTIGVDLNTGAVVQKFIRPQQTIKKNCYPVGAVFITTNPLLSPATKFGGKWSLNDTTLNVGTHTYYFWERTQ